MSITLYIGEIGTSANTPFSKSNMDLKAEGIYKNAAVSTGTWILYTHPNYNAQAGGSSSNYKVLKAGDKADITSVNGSMDLVQNATEGYILFDHIYYGGPREYFNEDCPDVKKAFSPQTISGISSVINLSHDEDLQIFNKPNYDETGLQQKLKKNTWYPTPTTMGLPNDAVQSIRKW